MDVEKILNKDYDKEEKQFYYLVKWRHLPKSKASWETKTDLIKDIPQMVQKFDKMIIDDPDTGYDKLVPEKILSKVKLITKYTILLNLKHMINLKLN